MHSVIYQPVCFEHFTECVSVYMYTQLAPTLTQKIRSTNIPSRAHQGPSEAGGITKLDTTIPIVSMQGMQMNPIITFCWLVYFAHGGVIIASMFYPWNLGLWASLGFFQAELIADDKLLLRKMNIFSEFSSAWKQLANFHCCNMAVLLLAGFEQ